MSCLMSKPSSAEISVRMRREFSWRFAMSSAFISSPAYPIMLSRMQQYAITWINPGDTHNAPSSSKTSCSVLIDCPFFVATTRGACFHSNEAGSSTHFPNRFIHLLAPRRVEQNGGKNQRAESHTPPSMRPPTYFRQPTTTTTTTPSLATHAAPHFTHGLVATSLDRELQRREISPLCGDLGRLPMFGARDAPNARGDLVSNILKNRLFQHALQIVRADLSATHLKFDVDHVILQ